MDVFSRTFHLAADAGRMTARLAGRHLPVFQTCVDPDDPTVLMTRCVRPGGRRATAGECLLLLTRRRMVVTQESPVLRRLSLHLNANLRHLSNVTFRADERASLLEIAATAVDGVRERFVIRLSGPDELQDVEQRLRAIFQPQPRALTSA